MSAVSSRRRRDSDDPPTRQTRESADSTFDGSLAQFDPLAGYAEHQDTSRTAPGSQQAERPHRPDATSSTSFGVKSDSQIGRTSKDGSEGMQRSNSSEAMPAQGVRAARRESWHAGQTTSSPEEAEMLRSSTSARLRRRSTSAQTKYRATALQPPKLLELRESDDEFRVSAARCPISPRRFRLDGRRACALLSLADRASSALLSLADRASSALHRTTSRWKRRPPSTTSHSYSLRSLHSAQFYMAAPRTGATRSCSLWSSSISIT